MKKIIDFIGKLPTTNVRIVSSIVMALGTWVKVLSTGWEPAIPWLAFLVAWAGVDAAQFTAKRMTHIPNNGNTQPVSSDALRRRTEGEEDGTEPV